RLSYCTLLTHPATTQIYTLSLHDALPIWCSHRRHRRRWPPRTAHRPRRERHAAPHALSCSLQRQPLAAHPSLHRPRRAGPWCARSEEHTSELQSRENLVCRLLLEKKTTTT